MKKGLLPGIDRVGVKFRNNEALGPEVLVAAQTMSAGAEPLSA